MNSNYLSKFDSKAARMADSQNVFIDLVEHEVNRLAAEMSQIGFKYRKAEHELTFNNEVELTVECSGRVNLDIEVSRPSGGSINGVQCKVGVFQKNRHRLDTKLEDNLFLPTIAKDLVVWKDRNGTCHTPHELCEFAFKRFFAHFGRAVIV